MSYATWITTTYLLYLERPVDVVHSAPFEPDHLHDHAAIARLPNAHMYKGYL